MTQDRDNEEEYNDDEDFHLELGNFELTFELRWPWRIPLFSITLNL